MTCIVRLLTVPQPFLQLLVLMDVASLRQKGTVNRFSKVSTESRKMDEFILKQNLRDIVHIFETPLNLKSSFISTHGNTLAYY